MKEFIRDQYYSQTEVCKLYKLTPKKFKLLTDDIKLIQNEITLHSLEGKPYQVKTLYILKTDWYKIVLDNHLNLKKI